MSIKCSCRKKREGHPVEIIFHMLFVLLLTLIFPPMILLAPVAILILVIMVIAYVGPVFLGAVSLIVLLLFKIIWIFTQTFFLFTKPLFYFLGKWLLIVLKWVSLVIFACISFIPFLIAYHAIPSFRKWVDEDYDLARDLLKQVPK